MMSSSLSAVIYVIIASDTEGHLKNDVHLLVTSKLSRAAVHRIRFHLNSSVFGIFDRRKSFIITLNSHSTKSKLRKLDRVTNLNAIRLYGATFHEYKITSVNKKSSPYDRGVSI